MYVQSLNTCGDIRDVTSDPTSMYTVQAHKPDSCVSIPQQALIPTDIFALTDSFMDDTIITCNMISEQLTPSSSKFEKGEATQ